MRPPLWVTGAAIAFLIGCGTTHTDEPKYSNAQRPIPALARNPYRLYLIEPETHRVYRITLDGAERELLVAAKPPTSKSAPPLQLASGSLNSFGGNRPGASLSLNNAIDGRGTITLQKEHAAQQHSFVLPIWEEFRIAGSSRESAKLGMVADYFARYKTYTIESPWSIHHLSKVTNVEDREISHVYEVQLRHRDGRLRRHRFRAHPAVRFEVLGIFQSRYAIVFDNPEVLLWDLETDVKTRIGRASDMRIVRFEPEFNSGPLRANVRIGADDFAWDLQTPTDLAIQGQHLVRKPAQ